MLTLAAFFSIAGNQPKSSATREFRKDLYFFKWFLVPSLLAGAPGSAPVSALFKAILPCLYWIRNFFNLFLRPGGTAWNEPFSIDFSQPVCSTRLCLVFIISQIRILQYWILTGIFLAKTLTISISKAYQQKWIG